MKCNYGKRSDSIVSPITDKYIYGIFGWEHVVNIQCQVDIWTQYLQQTLGYHVKSKPSPLPDNSDLCIDNSWYHAHPHPIMIYYPGWGLIW